MKTTIIIGGGLGGLFTGAILAKEGLLCSKRTLRLVVDSRVSIASANPLIQECTS